MSSAGSSRVARTDDPDTTHFGTVGESEKVLVTGEWETPDRWTRNKSRITDGHRSEGRRWSEGMRPVNDTDSGLLYWTPSPL